MANKNDKQIQIKPVDRLKEVMASESVKKQFQNALGENSNMFVASVIDLFLGSDSLQKCDPAEVVMQALKAATMKLPINPNLGFAYIVPFNNKPTFVVGYKGYIQLALRTGNYSVINTDVVYEGEYEGFDKLTGALNISGQKKSDKVVGYFAHIETVTGFKKTMYMSQEDMEKYGKKYSPSFASKYSPWQTDFESMGKKTMVRRLIGTYGEMSIDSASEMSRAESQDISAIDYQQNANSTLLDVDPGTGAVTVEGEPPTPEEVQAMEQEENALTHPKNPGY